MIGRGNGGEGKGETIFLCGVTKQRRERDRGPCAAGSRRLSLLADSVADFSWAEGRWPRRCLFDEMLLKGE